MREEEGKGRCCPLFAPAPPFVTPRLPLRPAQRVFVLLAFVPAHARHASQALAHEGRARLPHRQGQGCKGARPRPLYARAPSNSGLRQFSVDDFEACKSTPWEGVRNFEARNLMREMKVGDKVSGRPRTPPSREGSP